MAKPSEALYETYRTALSGFSLPLAWVDLDRFRENARRLVARANGRPIRLATKSVRCRSLLRLVLAEHPGFRGLMAYSAREAAWLAREGFDDVLVAYPTADREAIREVARAVGDGHRITLTVDSVEHVGIVSEVAAEVGVVVSLCLDLDMSSDFPGLHFGVQRSPLRTAEAAVEVARTIARTRSVRLDGVLGYEAQIAGVQDAVAGQHANNLVLRALKQRSLVEVIERRGQIVRALRADGHALVFVNGGGTGSLRETSTDPQVTELAAGSGLFAPTLFDGYQGLLLEPAAGFAVEVARIPKPGLFTCSGGGYVASGPGGKDRLPTPYLPEGGSLLAHEGAGEVQTPVQWRTPPALGLGDPVFFRHAKAGELGERFLALHAIEGGRAVEVLATYRGEGRCYI